MTVRVERDRWGPGPSILDPRVLESLRAALAIAPLIVEHWYYRGGRGPKLLAFDDFEELKAHLESARPGDAFDVWRYDQLCRRDNMFVSGKRPDDEDGAVPAGGPY
jgi:hypothetical protein